MDKMEWIAPCHFGLESVLKRELQDLGYEIVQVEDGRVIFAGEIGAAARANIFLRTAERILLKVGSFRAETFEELFERTREIPWEDYIPEDGKFWVAKAASVKSRLFSPSDIQSIMKKAMVERLKSRYRIEWFPESGAAYPVRVFLMKDIVTVGIDTTGTSLHKRGYRPAAGKAPIAENLAAALIMLTPWRGDRILVDPFCGSGTFPIEAAMMAAHIAPGMNRSFTAEEWTNVFPKKYWYEAVNEAQKSILFRKLSNYYGGDLAGRRIALWGLAFKPETDDMREAPSLVLIRLLREAGCRVMAYDPVAMDEARRRFQDGEIAYGKDIYETVIDADALLVVTEWKEFRMPSWAVIKKLMAHPLVLDGRNIYDKAELEEAGMTYHCIGR